MRYSQGLRPLLRNLIIAVVAIAMVLPWVLIYHIVGSDSEEMPIEKMYEVQRNVTHVEIAGDCIDETFRFPLAGYGARHQIYNHFEIESVLSFPQMKETIETANATHTAEIYGNQLLVALPRNDGTTFHCIVYKGKDSRQYYVYSLLLEIYLPNFSPEGSGSQSVVFPIHLVSNDVFERAFDDRTPISGDVYYKTLYDRGKFLQFYRTCGLYQIEENSDGFVLRGYVTANESYPEFTKAISFQFCEINGEKFFRASVVV